MKLSIPPLATACQTLTEVNNEGRVCNLKCVAIEVADDAVGEEWKGYVVWLRGRKDKQGFPKK